MLAWRFWTAASCPRTSAHSWCQVATQKSCRSIRFPTMSVFWGQRSTTQRVRPPTRLPASSGLDIRAGPSSTGSPGKATPRPSASPRGLTLPKFVGTAENRVSTGMISRSLASRRPWHDALSNTSCAAKKSPLPTSLPVSRKPWWTCLPRRPYAPARSTG